MASMPGQLRSVTGAPRVVARVGVEGLQLSAGLNYGAVCSLTPMIPTKPAPPTLSPPLTSCCLFPLHPHLGLGHLDAQNANNSP